MGIINNMTICGGEKRVRKLALFTISQISRVFSLSSALVSRGRPDLNKQQICIKFFQIVQKLIAHFVLLKNDKIDLREKYWHWLITSGCSLLS